MTGFCLRTFLTNDIKLESMATGAMLCFDSEMNFIGSVSFEGNHANIDGGKGNLKTCFHQYEEREPKSRHLEILFNVADILLISCISSN